MRYFQANSLAALLFASAQANALGVGDALITSRLGQPLRAEIRLLASPGENLDVSCFHLGKPAVTGDDLPWVTKGKASLQTKGQQTILVITSSVPFNEPIAMLALEVGCGMGLRREFTLLPATPEDLTPANGVSLPSVQPLSAPTQPEDTEKKVITHAPAAPVSDWETIEGETLQSIAEALYPKSKKLQRRFIRATIKANPGLFQEGEDTASHPFTAGTKIQIPGLTNLNKLADRNEQAQTASAIPSKRQTRQASTSSSQPKKKKGVAKTDRLEVGANMPRAATLAKMSKEERQRLTREQQLGAALEEQVSAFKEADDKIKKLESYVAELKTELSRLDGELIAAKIAVQQNTALAAQPLITPAAGIQAATAAVVEATPKSKESTNWPLIGAILAGSALVASALFFRRRNQQEVSANGRVNLDNPGQTANNLRRSGQTSTTPVSVSLEADARVEDGIHFPVDMRDAANTIGVHEHESAMELAEIMVSFGRIKEAAQTLEDFIQANPKKSSEPWLKLFDIYRQAGMKTEFVELSQRFSKYFNATSLKWEQRDEVNATNSIENFAHIKQRIVATWGTQACLDYLYLLVREKRQGERAGFPLAVLDEIMTLVSILESDGSLSHSKKAG